MGHKIKINILIRKLHNRGGGGILSVVDYTGGLQLTDLGTFSCCRDMCSVVFHELEYIKGEGRISFMYLQCCAPYRCHLININIQLFHNLLMAFV